jgi:curved DNA-binding protein CbpA
LNYYELLKIERGADASEIKRAYFSAVKLHSPDSDPDGFKAIRLAYETL